METVKKIAEENLPEVEELMYFDPDQKYKYERYLKDPNFIVIEDDEGGPTIVTKKYTDEDWDRVEDYFDNHPLFINDLTADDLENNEYLQALQAMKYDQEAEVLFEKFYVNFFVYFLRKKEILS